MSSAPHNDGGGSPKRKRPRATPDRVRGAEQRTDQNIVPQGSGINPVPDCRAAEEFLMHWKPGGPWPLCAFHENRGNQAFGTFGPDTVDQMAAWIDAQTAAKRNVYFHVNTVRAPKKGKAEKADVVSIDWVWI
jgi:hypothetical protein